MIYLVDTNVLLRFLFRADPEYTAIRAAVRILKARGDETFAALQNISEFWNVLTRPATVRGGYGLSITEAQYRLKFIERHFRVVPDPPSIYAEWKQIVISHSVKGVQVHDARIAALMKAHGIPRILTLNKSDFLRYKFVTAFDPHDISGI